MVVLTSHLTLFYTVTRPCMTSAWANLSGYFDTVQRDEMIGLETESGLGLLVGGRLVGIGYGWVSPMFVPC
jgi:hypothetical protein